ncbi:MAG: hypothetical protein Q7S28_01405, partial [bacterium]|nr:hypothetical protein [bacterium]
MLFGTLAIYRGKRFKRYFKTHTVARVITALAFIICLGAVMLTVYKVAHWEFIFIGQDIYLREALPFFVYEIFFLVIFGLVFANALISGLFQLFQGEDDAWIIASPKFRSLFFYKAWRVFLMSLWPVVLIALPALFGIRTAYDLAISGIMLALLGVILMSAAAFLLALIMLMAGGYVLSRISFDKGARKISIRTFALFAVLILIAFGAFTWRTLDLGDVVMLFAPRDATYSASSIDVITQKFMWLPSHPMARMLFHVQTHALSSVLAGLGVLGIASAILLVCAYFTSFFYLKLWQLLQEGSAQARTEELLPARAGSPRAFPRIFKTPLGALFEKESLIMFRRMKNMLWSGLLLFLWLVQVGLSIFIRHNMRKYHVDPSVVLNIVQSLHILIAAYFVAAFALRFAFPAWSSERRTAWILSSAPLNFKNIFWAKLFFYSLLFGGMGVLLAGLNAVLMGIPPGNALLFILFVAVTAVTVSIAGFCTGTLFPSLETDDPELLSTSLPGLGFTIGAVGYGA